MSEYLKTKAKAFLRKQQAHPNRDEAALGNIPFSFQYPVGWSVGKTERSRLQGASGKTRGHRHMLESEKSQLGAETLLIYFLYG